MSEAREMAATFLDHIVTTSYEAIDLEDLEVAFEIDTETAMAVLFEIGQSIVTCHWEDLCTCDAPDDIEEGPAFVGFSVGDPDPSPYDEYDDDDEDMCAATVRRKYERGYWNCTLPDHHAGQHIAGDGTEICAIWED